MPMKALITGGAGFIGSHIVDRLLAEGHKVIVLDDFSTGKRENLSDHKNLEVIECDIRNFDSIDKNMAGVDWVFHKAAVASVPKTVNDPIGSSQVNYLGSLNVLEAASKHQIKRLVFASSAALYGDEPTLPKVETMHPVTLSPYAVDKLATEYACGVYSKLYGLDTVCLRYFNVYGPRQDTSSPYSGVISIFSDKLNDRQVPTIFGDGEQTRDFVYISDVVEANMRALKIESGQGAIFNIATGERQTLNELLKIMCNIQQCEFAAEYETPRQGDIKDSYANIDKAAASLGWQPKIKLNEGLLNLL
jgi:UDP-glucose 4-epimerase